MVQTLTEHSEQSASVVICQRFRFVGETKLNHEFPNAQFLIDNYEIKNRRDRHKYGGGLIEYVKKGVVCRPHNMPTTVVYGRV